MAHILTTTICLTICLCAASKNKKFVELFGSVLAGSGAIVMAICNHTSLIEMNDNLNNQELLFFLIYGLLYAGILTTEFWWHLVQRVLWNLVSSIVVNTATTRKKDVNEMVAIVIMLTSLSIICELIFYVHMKQ